MEIESFVFYFLESNTRTIPQFFQKNHSNTFFAYPYKLQRMMDKFNAKHITVVSVVG